MSPPDLVLEHLDAPTASFYVLKILFRALCNSCLQSVTHLIAFSFSLQRYIIRIIFMVPTYAITSFLSLLHRESSIYFDTIRDW